MLFKSFKYSNADILGIGANNCRFAEDIINEETGEVIIDGNVVGTLDRVSVNALLATTLGATIKANMEKNLSLAVF